MVSGFGPLDTLCIAGSMAAAARDGARIVNLSSDVPGAKCGQLPLPDQTTLDQAQSVAKLFGKAVTYAQRIGKDVLWVFAAGNGCRDGKYESGPTVAGSFPQNALA